MEIQLGDKAREALVQGAALMEKADAAEDGGNREMAILERSNALTVWFAAANELGESLAGTRIGRCALDAKALSKDGKAAFTAGDAEGGHRLLFAAAVVMQEWARAVCALAGMTPKLGLAVIWADTDRQAHAEAARFGRQVEYVKIGDQGRLAGLPTLSRVGKYSYLAR